MAATTTSSTLANAAQPTTRAELNILCWACGVLVQVPLVNNELARVFRCGWCGAISEAAPSGSDHLRPRRRGLWRTLMRTLSHLSYAVLFFVLGLILSIVVPGIGIVLPALCTTTASWLTHITISYFLTAGVIFNYFAAVATSPGTVLECCEDLPPAFGAPGPTGSEPTPPGPSHALPSATPGDESAGDTADHTLPASTADATPGVSCATEGESPGADSIQAAEVALAEALAGDSGPQNAAVTSSTPAGGSGAICLETGRPGGHEAAARGGTAQPTEEAPSAGDAGRFRAVVPQSCYSHLRYCWPCRGPQPLRAHHCYMCGVCVVDQDHHCPFIANCVGRANTRNFISFLAFTILAVMYSAIMSGLLLIRQRAEVKAALRSAAAAMMSGARWRAASRAPPPLGPSTTLMGRIGGRVLSWTSKISTGLDMWGAYLVLIISRTPLHISVAAYILIISLAVLLALSVLFVQSVYHATSCDNALAASRAAQHNLHPAADAAAPANTEARCGILARLHRVMVGDVTRDDKASSCHTRGVGNDGRESSRRGRGSGSMWLWIWPMWGPPPGVLVGSGRTRFRTPRAQTKPLKQGGWQGAWKRLGGLWGRRRLDKDAAVVRCPRTGSELALGGPLEGVLSSGAEAGRSGMKTKTQ